MTPSTTNTAARELLPCPFCGKEAMDQWPNETLDASGDNCVRCAWCHGAAPMKTWNRRTLTQQQGGEQKGDGLPVAFRWVRGDEQTEWHGIHLFNENADRKRHHWGWETQYATDALRTKQPAASEGDGKAWRCFLCDESFTDEGEAALHFGTRMEGQTPACTIDVAEYRRMEAQAARYADEDADIHRAMYAQQSKHAAALKRAEEDGYAKGLRDSGKCPCANTSKQAAGEAVALSDSEEAAYLAKRGFYDGPSTLSADIASMTTPPTQQEARSVDDEMVERAARIVAELAGEDFDLIGGFAQGILLDTQRAALTAALQPGSPA